MARKKIKSIGPFRYISKKDKNKKFTNELYELNKVTLSNLLPDNKGATHVFVYEYQSDVLAFIVIHDKGTHFHVDLVESNRLFSSGIKPGTKLMKFVESLSTQYKYKKITLISISDRIPYYGILGYSKIGKMFNEVTYGPVIHMFKKL